MFARQVAQLNDDGVIVVSLQYEYSTSGAWRSTPAHWLFRSRILLAIWSLIMNQLRPSEPKHTHTQIHMQQRQWPRAGLSRSGRSLLSVAFICADVMAGKPRPYILES